MDASIAAIAPYDGPEPGAAAAMPAGPAPGTGIDFVRVFEREVSQLNTDVQAAESGLRDLAAGKPVELHEVMIRLERARLSVQVFVQVRNKIVESYQDLMRMQA
jgi:flagellar hook-basal body complex protein FliE